MSISFNPRRHWNFAPIEAPIDVRNADARTLLESVPFAVIITDCSERDVVLYVNSRYTVMSGRDRASVIGTERGHRQLQPKIDELRGCACFKSYIDIMKHNQNEVAKQRQAFKTGGSYEGTQFLFRSTREGFWCRIHLQQIFGCFVDGTPRRTQRIGYLQDVSDRVNLEHALRDDTVMYTRLLDTVPGFISHFEIASKDGKPISTRLQKLYGMLKRGEPYLKAFKRDFDTNFLYASNGSREMVGLDAHAICSPRDSAKWLFDTIHVNDRDTFFERLFASASNGDPCRWSGRFTLMGQTKHVQLDSVAEIQTGGDRIQWFISGLDVTREATTQANIARFLEHENRGALQQLQATLDTLRQTTNAAPPSPANAPHSASTAALQAALPVLQHAVNRLTLNLDDFGAVNSTVDAPTAPVVVPVLDTLSVHALVEATFERFPQSQDRLHNAVAPDITIKHSRVQLMRILGYLVDYALTRPSDDARVVLEATWNHRKLRLVCSTNAPFDASIFQKYHSIAPPMRFASGLGMVRMKMCVERANGTCRVEADEGATRIVVDV